MGLKLKQDVVVVVRRKKGRKDGIEEREKESVRRNKNCRVENDERERERDNYERSQVPFPFTGIVMSRVGIN